MTYTDPAAIDLNTGFVVAIQLVAKDGEAEAVAAILQYLVAPTMSEPGVKFFMPYRSPTNPSAFFIYELYEDEAAWDAHNTSAHFLSVVDALVEKVAFRERVPFVPFIR